MAFTRAELANYDGRRGNPAYVAFQGKVYDISQIQKAGQLGFEAGVDLTNQLDMQDEIRAVLDKGIVVGGMSDG